MMGTNYLLSSYNYLSQEAVITSLLFNYSNCQVVITAFLTTTKVTN